jgi:hypothetical protein
MNNFSKYSFCLLLLFIFCNIICVAQKTDTASCRLLDSSLQATAKISLKISGDFKMIKKTEMPGNIKKMEFKSSSDQLMIKTYFNIEDSNARKIMEDKRFLIDNLFKTQPSPYPDVVSNSINCPDRFKPVPTDSINENMWMFAYKIFANDRFVFGECTDDEAFYTSAYIFIYSRKNKTLNEIKYFTPKSTPVYDPLILAKRIICTE